MTLPPLIKRYLNLGTSHATNEEDRRLIKQCNFAIAMVVLTVFPLIAIFSDIGNTLLMAALLSVNFGIFILALILNISGYNQVASTMITTVTMLLSPMVVFVSDVQTGAPLTNLIVAVGANYLLKNNSLKLIISSLAVAMLFFLGYYQYKYLPFDEQEYYISSIMLVLMLLLTHYSIRQSEKYQRRIEAQNMQIAEQRDHLKELNSTKNKLFSIISHDIRGPITVLLGYNELIEDHLKRNYNAADDQQLKEINQHLNHAARQVTTLLDNLLKWALKEEGVMKVQATKLSVKTCITETIEILQPQASAKGISFIDQTTEDQHVLADKDTFYTAIRNLASNALKFTGEQGTVSFSAVVNQEEVHLAISDTGVGIPADKLDSLFLINEEKITAGTQGEKGTGLGLSLVHDFISMNKGRVEVSSELNVGTTFTVTLPLA